jgi:hypothetical protein
MFSLAKIGLGFGLPAAPEAPMMSVIASGNSVVASIVGDTGATHYLKYKGSSYTAWQTGGSRVGDGTITIVNLEYNVPYIFIAQSFLNGLWSLPAVAIIVTLAEAAASRNEFDQNIIDATSEILNAMGESIVYLPAGGGRRPILAIVDREGQAGLPGMRGTAPITTITVANDSTSGISSSEIDTANDMAELALREGDPVGQHIITKIISEDAGMMTLEVR